MHEYLFDTEVVRIAILLGIVVSMLFYDRNGVTTGGAIVPGYLALFLPVPLHIVSTLSIAVATYWIVQKHLRPRLMLWGRRLFEAEILVALTLQTIWIGALFFTVPEFPQLSALYGIGFLVPGIIAHDMGRQKAAATIKAALICAVIVFGLITLIDAFRGVLGFVSSPQDNILYAQQYAYPTEWLLLSVILSVLASIGLYHYQFFKRIMFLDAVRTGGFVTAAYLALFVFRPLDLLFVSSCAAITFLIVTQFLMKWAILFGRSKMAAMFLTGMIVTWMAELGIYNLDLDYVPWAGFSAITPTIVALLANDTQRQGPVKTFAGVSISTATVLVVVTLVHFGYEQVVWGQAASAMVK